MEVSWGTTAERTFLVPDAEHLKAVILAAKISGARLEIRPNSSYAEMQDAALRYQSYAPEAERETASDRAMMAMFAGGALVWLQIRRGPGKEPASLDVFDSYYVDPSGILSSPDCSRHDFGLQ